MSFAELGLSEEILRAVADQGYSEPTPIQKQAIPAVLSGRDILAAAQTGTGKTAGFTLPILRRLQPQANNSHSPAMHPVRALILTPTRELADQVGDSVKLYGKHLPLRSSVVFGGVNIEPQTRELRAGVEILVATPGRLLDHVQQKSVNLSRVEVLVMDEADRMLDMGFLPDIRRILALLPANRQTLLFSATFSPEIKKLADQFLKTPLLIEVARQNQTSEQIEQRVHSVEMWRKRSVLAQLVRKYQIPQVIVFCNTRHGAEKLSRDLVRDGFSADAIHGEKSQQQRLATLAEFKEGRLAILVATDVAARGLDIDQLPFVVNYDLPNAPEDYVHRIGRTGRAGSKGVAISLVAPEEQKQLAAIEKLVKQSLPVSLVQGFEPGATPAKEKPSPAALFHTTQLPVGERPARFGTRRAEQVPALLLPPRYSRQD